CQYYYVTSCNRILYILLLLCHLVCIWPSPSWLTWVVWVGCVGLGWDFLSNLIKLSVKATSLGNMDSYDKLNSIMHCTCMYMYMDRDSALPVFDSACNAIHMVGRYYV
ncbi:hypothetical protein T310_8659, partial [Rasamsonia emersonii CBS 393.64]